MKISRISSFAALVAMVISLPTLSFGAPQVKDDKDLPKSGSLAVSSMSGAAVSSFPDPFGSEDPSGNEVSPITGSVSRINKDEWSMKVFNNSKDTYSVNLEMVQRDERSIQVRRDFFTFTLKPQSSASRTVPSGLNAREAELNLKNWSNVSKKKAAASPTATPPASRAGASKR